jgi:hypothetical protein
MNVAEPGGTGSGGTSATEVAGLQPRGGPTVLRMLLGIQLRRLRENCGITPDQAGYEIRASRSKISRVERHPGTRADAGPGSPGQQPGLVG